MSLITRMRKQKAVYWGSPTPDGTGDYTFATAVEIDCRWEDTQKLIRDSQGKEIVATAKVYVDRDVVVGGFLKLGTLVSLASDHTNPRLIEGAQEIRSFGKLPNFKVTEYLRTAWL